MKTYQVDENGYYGEFGGAYVPEILHQCVENLQKKYLEVLESDSFKKEFNQLLLLQVRSEEHTSELQSR